MEQCSHDITNALNSGYVYSINKQGSEGEGGGPITNHENIFPKLQFNFVCILWRFTKHILY